MVLPAVYYAAPIWSAVINNDRALVPLDRVTRQLGLLVFGCLKTSAYAAVHFLSGIYVPRIEIQKRVVQLGLRLTALGKLCDFSSLTWPVITGNLLHFASLVKGIVRLL